MHGSYYGKNQSRLEENVVDKEGVVVMKIKWIGILTYIISFMFCSFHSQAAARQISDNFKKVEDFRVQNVSVDPVVFRGKDALRIALLPETAQGKPGVDYIDRDTLAIIPGTEGFHNGIIDVDVIGQLSPTAPDYARAFLGIAFRVADDISQFETLYVRPTNARADDQVRRNHTLQYFSFPNYTFSRFRQEAPERYESYADLDMDGWTHIRIEIVDEKAKMYINGAVQPSLIVNDLKMRRDATGSVGLWTEIGTIAYFSNLKVSRF